MRLYFITSLQLFFLIIPLSFAFSQTIKEIRTMNGETIQIQFSYGLIETISEEQTLTKQRVSEKDTFKVDSGGIFRVIPTEKIPFGRKFGVFWVVLNGDHNDSFPLKVEYTTSGRKIAIPLIFPIKNKVGHFYAQQEEKDEPGNKIIAIFQGEKLLISSMFDVYR